MHRTFKRVLAVVACLGGCGDEEPSVVDFSSLCEQRTWLEGPRRQTIDALLRAAATEDCDAAARRLNHTEHLQLSAEQLQCDFALGLTALKTAALSAGTFRDLGCFAAAPALFHLGVGDGTMEPLATDQVAGMSSLRSLALADLQQDPELLVALLPPNSQIEYFSASSATYSLEPLSALERLRDVALTSSAEQPLVAAQLERVARIPALDTLELHGPRAAGALDALAGADRLVDLWISDAAGDLSAVARLPALRRLALGEVSGENLTRLARSPVAPRLERMTLSWSSGTPEGSALGSFTGLRELRLSGTPARPIDALPALPLPQLLVLEVVQHRLQSYTWLESLVSLQHLVLSGAGEVAPLDLAGLQQLPLRVLGLSRMQVTGWEHMAAQRSLEMLSLAAMKIPDIGVLQACPRLTSLRLTGVELPTLLPLASMPTLAQLSVDRSSRIELADGCPADSRSEVVNRACQAWQSLAPEGCPVDSPPAAANAACASRQRGATAAPAPASSAAAGGAGPAGAAPAGVALPRTVCRDVAGPRLGARGRVRSCAIP